MDTQYHGIRAVVFDLGGVVIDLNRDAAVEALQRLGVLEADDLLNPYRQQGIFLRLETGQTSEPEFYDDLRRRCLDNGFAAPSDRQIADAFCRFLVALPVERLVELRRLRYAGLKVYALSNTNPVMYNSWIASAFRQQGLAIGDYFDGVVASFQEGHCKPDPAIFHILTARYALDGATTLFLDDSEKNCLAAMRLGIRTAHVTPTDDMLSITSRICLP